MAADAGGFAVREQSTEFQGMSFAGNGAGGGGLSGMFWNPAVAAYAPAGIYSEAHYAAIIGRVEIVGDTFAGAVNLGLNRDSGDIAKDAIVPSSYLSYRLTDKLVFAMSVNSPFGLVTEPSNRNWAGQTFARTSEIKTYNFTPTLAYRVTPTLAIGVGLQIEHIEGRLKSASGIAPTSLNFVVKGDDTAFGFTAGINWNPNPGTHIGLGYRSSIDHTLEGTGSIPGSPIGPAASGVGIKAGTTLPEIVTLSLRQALTPTWTVLGTVEWTHWERAQKLDITCANTAPNAVFCPGGNGQLVRSLALGWHDSWFMSLGAEHRYSDKLTLRGGVAYEISPVQEADERSLRVPDMDRLWLSLGATYKWNDKIAMDFAYTHIFGVGDDKIDRTEGGLRFVGHVDSQVDIISGSLKIKLGDVPHHHEPLK
ncbi:MAG: OmpP1/FadL family transporter [Hyphomicrobiaceae bacterium]